MHENNNSEIESAVQVRMTGPILISLENWRRAQPKIPARSQALRILLEQALAKEGFPVVD